MSHEDLTNQEKLEEIYKMTLENNNILHGMRSRERIANALRIVYWLIILGAIGGAFYVVSPILNAVVKNRDKIETTLQQFEQLRGSFPESKAFNTFLNSFKGNSTSTPSTSSESTQITQ